MNKIKEKYKQIIEDYIAPFILDLGYNRKKNYFYYTDGGKQFSYEILLEKFKKSTIKFSILAGANNIYLDKEIGKKVKKHSRRYDNLYSKTIFEIATKQQHVDYYIEADTDNKILIKQILEHLKIAEHKFNEIQTHSDLLDLCIQENQLVHHDDIFKYLAITKDNKRMEIYLPLIKQRLYFIADSAFNSYKERLDLYKKEFE